MTHLCAMEFPEQAVRRRARIGTADSFPPLETYGRRLFGATYDRRDLDPIDATRLVPPVFMPCRLEQLIDLGREPSHADVELETGIGGFRSSLPVYVSAFGSTSAVDGYLGACAGRQAAAAGIPLVIGENVMAMNGTGRAGQEAERSLLSRINSYAGELSDDDRGGLVIQQSTADADAEVWNLAYTDRHTSALLDSGRLAFELKVGQGAKPGIGGMTVIEERSAARVAEQYALDDILSAGTGRLLRSSRPGTFTEEILRQQVRLMRNNFPRAKIWVKLHPGRDVGQAALIAWEAGADAVTVDGAEGGTGWAPNGFLDHVGLPLAECLRRVGHHSGCLLASGRMWEGTRAVKALALGANAIGLGRAALLAVDEDGEAGLTRLLECLAVEMQLLISSLGKYTPADLETADIWSPTSEQPVALPTDQMARYPR